MSPALGYAIDDPEAIASFRSDKHWNMALLMEAVPYTAPPSRYLVPSIRPTALDQDGIGACVAFGAETIKDAQDFVDWGKHLYISGSYAAPKSGAFLAYDWLKNGHGTFPGDGIPNAEGSFPEAVCKLAKAEGLPDKDGKAHKITAYYAHNLANAADLAFLQSVLMEYGPVQIGIPWSGWNWMAAPPGPNFIMPPPGPATGGHSFAVVGWETYNGVLHLTFMNSWGFWGNAQGLFRFPASWLYQAPLGPQIIWKTVDAIDAPFPPPPEPGGPMLVRIDRTPRLVDSAVGKNCYAADGVTLVTPLLGTAGTPVPNLNSPSAYGVAAPGPITYYSVEITFRGLPQLAWMKVGDVTNVRPNGADPAALDAARKAGDSAGARAVKDAAIAEALLHGG